MIDKLLASRNRGNTKADSYEIMQDFLNELFIADQK
jgi:hypothetical protein